MRLRFGAATDTGRVRDLNEDAYGLRVDQGLFVVCDGMGGCPAGEVASRIAVDAILEHLDGPAHDRADGFEEREPAYLPQTSRLADAVRRSNRCIYDQAQHDSGQADMGTTVVAAWIEQSIASVAHVGDSRAYLWHNDQLEPLTRDHSLVEAYVRAGVMDRDESLQSDQRNVLLRVLGRAPAVDVELNEVPVQLGHCLRMLEHDFRNERAGLQIAAAFELEQVAFGTNHGALIEPLQQRCLLFGCLFHGPTPPSGSQVQLSHDSTPIRQCTGRQRTPPVPALWEKARRGVPSVVLFGL